MRFIFIQTFMVFPMISVFWKLSTWANSNSNCDQKFPKHLVEWTEPFKSSFFRRKSVSSVFCRQMQPRTFWKHLLPRKSFYLENISPKRVNISIKIFGSFFSFAVIVNVRPFFETWDCVKVVENRSRKLLRHVKVEVFALPRLKVAWVEGKFQRMNRE